jgi:low affinity Fe/Cu permease
MVRRVGILERIATSAASWTGSSWAFTLAAAIVLVWGITGPLFRWSDTWQLVINTGTTIVTFLMVFLLQRSQNKDSQAIQLKLNELVAALRGASNQLINLEDSCEEDLRVLHAHYDKLAELARKEQRITESHSVAEAVGRHRSKTEPRDGCDDPGETDDPSLLGREIGGTAASDAEEELAALFVAVDQLREKLRSHAAQPALVRPLREPQEEPTDRSHQRRAGNKAPSDQRITL